MRKVTKVRVLERFRIELTFDNGRCGIIDLAYLAGKGLFRIWDTPGAFEAVRIGSSGELQWGDQADLCPDALYLKMTGQKAETVFPGLMHEPAHARD
ncbi:MAG: DUF2442 domain-containing protein [Planctomycetota bacterium]